MSTTAIAAPAPRGRGLFARFGEATRAAWNWAVSGARRALGWAQLTGYKWGARLRGWGAALWSGIRTGAAWSGAQVVKLPRLAMMGLGWALTGVGLLIDTFFLLIILILAVFAFLGVGAIKIRDGYDHTVQGRARDMRRGRPVLRSPLVPEDERLESFDDYEPRPGHVVIEDITEWSPEHLESIVATGQLAPSETIADGDLEPYWKRVSDHFKGEDLDLCSHFWGRSLAARQFMNDPMSNVDRPIAWFLGQEDKAVDQRNAQAATRPELKISKPSFREGMTQEIYRLQKRWSQPATPIKKVAQPSSRRTGKRPVPSPTV